MPQLESDVHSLSTAQPLEMAVDLSVDLSVNLSDLSVDCQDQPQGGVDARSPDYCLGLWLSHLLKYGVILASLTVFIGGVLYLMRHGMEPVNYQVFQGEPAMFRSPQGVVDAVLSGHRRGIIQLGLMLLMATPVIRVAVSLFFFIWQRDLMYGVITALVLSGLLYSSLSAYF